MKIHLDTDLAGDPDDVCALAMLLTWPGVEITGITTVAESDGRRAGYVEYVLQLAGRSEIRSRPVPSTLAATTPTTSGCLTKRPTGRSPSSPHGSSRRGARSDRAEHRRRRDDRRHRPAYQPRPFRPRASGPVRSIAVESPVSYHAGKDESKECRREREAAGHR